MKAAILFSFIVSAIAIQCPNYECGTVAAGVCAQVQNSSILLNQDGCPNGQACNLTQVWDPIGAIPANSVQCVSEAELDTNPLKLLNITEFLMPLLNQSNLELQPGVSGVEGNVTAVQGNVTAVQGNVTAAQANVTVAQGTLSAAQGNLTTAQGNVTAAQGTLTAAQGNVTEAQGNVTEAQGNVTAAQGNVSAAQVNATGAQGNVSAAQVNATGAQGNVSAAQVNATTAQGGSPVLVNITTNATGTTVETNNTTGGGSRRLQGGRGGVGAPIPGGPSTTVNVTTISLTSNATNATATPTPTPGAPPGGQPNATIAAPANVTTPITTLNVTTVNVTTVPPLGNATAGQPGAQPGAQPSPPQPSSPANVTAVPISSAPNATAPGPEAPAPTPPPANQTAAAPTNATLVPANVTEVQPSENITSTGQENITSEVAGILQAQNQTAPSGQSTATLENTPVISTDNATNTTVLDVSNIAQTLSQFIQKNESGYNVDIPGVGFISIQSEQPKISCVIAKNRNLVSGQPPVKCETDADCQLEDGTFATCICGMDGTSYCKPDYYDDVFSAFTDQCKNGEMDQEVFVEWVRYHHYYIPLQTAPDCGEDLFIELQRASQSEQIAAQSSGEMLALSLAMILLLLT